MYTKAIDHLLQLFYSIQLNKFKTRNESRPFFDFMLDTIADLVNKRRIPYNETEWEKKISSIQKPSLTFNELRWIQVQMEKRLATESAKMFTVENLYEIVQLANGAFEVSFSVRRNVYGTAKPLQLVCSSDVIKHNNHIHISYGLICTKKN